MARGKGGTAAERWRERLARWPDSGLSISEFCWREGVSEPSFYQWRKRLKRELSRNGGHASRKPVFVPVQVVDAGDQATCLAASDSVGTGEGAMVEVVLPGGVRVRFGLQVDESRLRSVLRAVVTETRGC